MGHHTHPHLVYLPAGDHAVCQCGASDTPPLCDQNGRNRCRSLTLSLEAPRTVAICACGISRTLPLCDGSHGYDKSRLRHEPRKKNP